MEEPSAIEDWKRISVLGSGAFGIVSLWRHNTSDDLIAIKKCKFGLTSNISARQRQRWENEVTIMKSLGHPNIVAYKLLPPALEQGLARYNPTELPLLSMEYCSRGNLRHVLNQPHNLCGLPENQVRAVLEDITKAVSYLHRFNVTHRDIKPDNIVLQACDEREGGVVYKLIDLGYAKELGDPLVSFVGTLHYLAPEIVRMNSYNFSVDYWSLGVVVFEVVCGVLPFLPYLTPFERFQHIEKKKPEHICIYQLMSGSVVSSSEMLKENHVSTCLKQNVESWLKHVLQFDPELRSRRFPDDAEVFGKLLEVLQKKIVTVFSVPTLEFYSYEINESTLAGTLKDWIARDTKVQRSELVLLARSRDEGVTDDQFVASALVKDDLTLYAFKKGAFTNRDVFTLPKYVRVLFDSCTKKYKWRELRVLYSKSLFFLSQEDKLVTSLIAAFDLLVRHTSRSAIDLKVARQRTYKTVSDLIVKCDCYFNLRSYNDPGPGVTEDYNGCLSNFKRLIGKVKECVCDVNRLIKTVDEYLRRQIKLDKSLPVAAGVVEACDIGRSVAEAGELLAKGGPGPGDESSSKEMCQIINRALKAKDKLLFNKDFQNYAKATSVALRDVETVLAWIAEFDKSVVEVTKDLDDNERRQYQILLAGHAKNSGRAAAESSKNGTDLDSNAVIKENQEVRCRFEEMLSGALLEHKKFCEESNALLAKLDF